MEISAVRPRNSYQMFYIDTNNIFVRQHALCVVETEQGTDLGNVVKSGRYQNNPDIQVKGKLLRLADDKDLEKLKEIEEVEQKAFQVCREKSRERNLDMKLITVKSLIDRSKIIFYFVSENRVDFRDLVRELASVFRTRIEMRQIGVRDEARLVGGFGPCGRKQCCSNFREDFEPVSIKMAKEQNLNLNSLKISGMCGRLLCCLGYEYDVYRDFNRDMPRLGSEIHTEKKKYHVFAIDTLKESLSIRSGDRILVISKHDLEYKNNRYTIREKVIEEKLLESDEDSHENYFAVPSRY